MKKYMILMIVVIFVMALSSTAFAVTTLKGPAQGVAAVSTTIGSATYQPSTNVQVLASATTNNYCVAGTHNLSLHATGGRAFGATTSSGLMFSDISAAAAAIGGCDTATPPQLNGGGTAWTTL